MELLIRQTPVYETVKREAETDTLRHAYLLTMDDKRNLRAALKAFAKLFFPASHRTSTLIDSESFSDCLFYPTEEGKKFTVEDAEAIGEEATLKPVEGACKLFVVEFTDATPQAQNKLLKLLEEPPTGVRFLLGSTTAFSVLSTVLSRTSKLELPPFSDGAIEDFLRRRYPTATDLRAYAAASGGSAGTAQSFLEGGYYGELLESAFLLAETDIRALPAVVKKTGETKRKKELLTLLRLVYRDALSIQLKTGVRLTLEREKERLNALAARYTPHTLLHAQEALTKAERETRFNAAFTQCLELTLTDILRDETNEKRREKLQNLV